MTDEPVSDYEIEPGKFPADLLLTERWFVWRLDQGRKIPRAPWSDEHTEETYASWKNENIWTDFETADEWVTSLDGYGHASCIPDIGDNNEARIIFFDFDNVRNPETGEIHPHAWGFIQAQGLHAAISTSGTGVHGFGYGSLPEGYKASFKRELPEWEHTDDPELEVYAESRFLALTGEHIAGTPVGVPDLSETAAELFVRFGEKRATGVEREPEVTREELEDIDTTRNIEEIYDAIAQTRPRDIRLRSSKTGERADGTVNLDPSWANSESGTRLAQFDDHWLYRKGNHNLDALQVVALEEGILRDESAYPEGEDFFDAVDALRDRGAHIPDYESASSPTLDVVAEARNETNNTPMPEGNADNEDSGQTTETDGGAAAVKAESENTVQSSQERFGRDVIDIIELTEKDDDDAITDQTARHRIAKALCQHFSFVHPEEEVRGWQTSSPSKTVIYVYDSDMGIYEPRGVAFIERQLERAAGDYVTNQVVNEIVNKVKRISTERGEQFECEPEKLVVGNGILNLHTGELTPYTPTEYHRQKIDIDWNPDAGKPVAIDEFLHEVVDDSDVPTMYRLIAHTLYKEYIGEKAAILIGSGENGKSVFIDLIEHFIGGHNITHRELQDFDNDDFAANNLEGKLANLATEIGEQELSETTAFKKLTGRDTMDAQVKYQNPVTFENFATMMFATNEMPVFGQDNHAIWRRWVYVDFPYEFSDRPGTKDPEPRQQLLNRITADSQLEALLVRCQQEIQRWHNDPDADFFADAMPPEQVRDKMKKAAEPVYAFATSCLEAGDIEETYTEKSVVRAAYRAFAEEEDLPTVAENEFGKRLLAQPDFMIDNGQKRIENSMTQVYKGIELSPRGRAVLGIDDPDNEDQGQLDDDRQKTAVVLDELREMVKANDGKPVPREGVVWRCTGDMTKNQATNALDALISESGRAMKTDDGIMPTDV